MGGVMLTMAHQTFSEAASGEPGARVRKTINAAEIEVVFRTIRDETRRTYREGDSPYSFKWAWELLCSELPPNSKYLGLIFFLHGGLNGNDKIFPSLDRLQALSGLSRATISTHEKKLAGAGYVSKTAGGGRKSNVYVLAIPVMTIAELSQALDAIASSSTSELQRGRSSSTIELNGSSSTSELQKSRSSSIGARSSSTIEPDLIDLKDNSIGSTPAKGRKTDKGTFLTKDMFLPPDWGERACSMGLSDSEVAEEFRKFHRYYTSRNREVWQKRQRDWMEKWVEWLERYLAKRCPSESYGPNGKYIGRTL
jgi:hypothetical protein